MALTLPLIYLSSSLMHFSAELILFNSAKSPFLYHYMEKYNCYRVLFIAFLLANHVSDGPLDRAANIYVKLLISFSVGKEVHRA